MIRLTGVFGSDIYVNTDNIIGIYKRTSDGYTNVDHGHDSYVVKESPEEVARKVLEYRLEKDWHAGSIFTGNTQDASLARNKLIKLAGLEEQKDE